MRAFSFVLFSGFRHSLPAAGRAQYSEKADMGKAYYVVIGIWLESGEPEVINGFYSRREACEEAACHRHTHKTLRVVRILDTQEAMRDLIASLSVVGVAA